mgnify:CR=1 FL=1
MVKEIVIYLEDLNFISIFLRVLMAVIFGGIIGYGREREKRPAGLRTHILVSVGATLAMITNIYLHKIYNGETDLSRLGAQVISGIGFLGAGTIIVTGKNKVRGLTTAAGLWTCAGIGLSIGIGFYSGAAITTILVLVIYRFMGRVDEIAYEHSRVLDIYIEFESRRSIAPFISVLKQNNYKIVQMELNKSKKNKEELVNATLVLEVPEKTKHGIVIDLLREIPGIEYVEEI